MPGCVTHLKVLFVFAGIYRDTEKKTVVMETAGAEALSVFPSENPSRHIRISTAKKVCWDFVLCKAWWFPGASRPAWVPGRNTAGHHSLLMRTPVESSKSHCLNRLWWERGCEEEHSRRKSWIWACVGNSVDMARMLIFA